jgi:hypothetical protein
MTKKDHLQKLRTLAEDPTLLGNGVGISLNTNGFWYGWKLNNSDNLASLTWCGAGSNRRHKDFQSFALPTELPHRFHSLFLKAVAKVNLFLNS